MEAHNAGSVLDLVMRLHRTLARAKRDEAPTGAGDGMSNAPIPQARKSDNAPKKSRGSRRNADTSPVGAAKARAIRRLQRLCRCNGYAFAIEDGRKRGLARFLRLKVLGIPKELL